MSRFSVRFDNLIAKVLMGGERSHGNRQFQVGKGSMNHARHLPLEAPAAERRRPVAPLFRWSRSRSIDAQGEAAAIRAVVIALAVFTLLPAAANAGFTTHLTLSSFNGATGTSGINLINFESQSVGSLPNGSAIDGVTFVSLAATGLSINNDFSTTSGTKYLGSTDSGNFGLIVAGDSIRFLFSQPIYAFGLFLATADLVLAGDFRLDAFVNGSLTNSASNSATPDFMFGGTGAYFLGFTDTTQSYTSVELNFSAAANGAFVFSLDDLRHGSIEPAPVPLPSSALLLMSSGAGVFLVAGRRRRG
jgi:hypothetical protein